MINYSKKQRFFINRNLTETQYIIRRIKIGFESYISHINNNASTENKNLIGQT